MIIKQEAIQLFHFPLIILPLKNGQTSWSLACPFFLLWWASRGLRNQNMQKPRTETSSRFLCWHYLFSRAVARKVFSAHTSLTSVFGMGTGGPSLQSTPTYFSLKRKVSKRNFHRFLLLTVLFNSKLFNFAQ